MASESRHGAELAQWRRSGRAAATGVFGAIRSRPCTLGKKNKRFSPRLSDHERSTAASARRNDHHHRAQPDIWPQYILLAILAVVGPPVEWLFDSLWWLLLWLVGDLTGELVSFAWEPQGAGASVGIFGSMGAWLVLLIWRKREPAVIVAMVVFALIVNMIGLALSTPLIAAILAAGVATLINGLLRPAATWQHFAPWLGARVCSAD